MENLRLNKFYSGGLITNYYCSSKCRHCLYGSSPGWKKEYITKEMTRAIFKKLRSLGIYSIHIGGGEPFLNIPSLIQVVKTAAQEGITIEYIETNSSWYRDEKSGIRVLKELKDCGIDTLLISISPFHNEYIPFYKVKGVINACKKAGISIFPWLSEFYSDIDAFNDDKPHKLEEYLEHYGANYLKEVNYRFGLTMRGRALKTYKNIYKHTPLEKILENNGGCKELEQTTHFHIDLYGNYIPGLCSGLAIDYRDLGEIIDKDKYPIITTLYTKGIRGLHDIAVEKFGFHPENEYLSKCHLCFEIRKFLVTKTKSFYNDLAPQEYYLQV